MKKIKFQATNNNLGDVQRISKMTNILSMTSVSQGQ